jgi:hypothetical protein
MMVGLHLIVGADEIVKPLVVSKIVGWRELSPSKDEIKTRLLVPSPRRALVVAAFSTIGCESIQGD